MFFSFPLFLATSASFIINCLILSSLVVFLKSVLFYF